MCLWGFTLTPVEPGDGRLENLVGAWTLRAVTTLDDALADASGLGLADCAALVSLLNYAEGENIATLRRGLRLSQPGSAHAVERLVRLGLVERQPSPSDRRAVVLVLTAAGNQRACAVLAARRAAMSELLAPLAAGERAALEGTLDKLLSARSIDVDTARHVCRLCDADACGHPGGCPVTRSVEARATGKPPARAGVARAGRGGVDVRDRVGRTGSS